MALEKITFRPGINRQLTPTLNEGGWSNADKVRFKDGLPQPIGGWARTLATPFQGICRKLHSWVTLAGSPVRALATSAKLYVASGDTLNDITPAGLQAGFADVPYARGFGAGKFGAGKFGTSRSSVVTSGALRLWSLDHWGEELIACPRDGSIYRWQPATGLGTAASLVPGTPTFAKGILVGMPERHLIAFGCSVGVFQDPLLVGWSDVEDYTVWTATATNSAGTFRLVGGSQIMGWSAAQQEILIWTDTTLWAMRFEGLPFVYGFFQQGEACGLIAPNAGIVLNGVAYWMGRAGFFRYAGQVQPLPCTVWDDVFRNLNWWQQPKVHCGTNMGYNEITWFYPSAGSVEIDRYVTVNVVDGTWTTGTLSRTAWEDAKVFANPAGTGPDGQLYAHEFGTDADGTPLDAWIESGDFDLGDGQMFSFVDQIIPDFADQTGAVAITVKAQAYPGGNQRVKGPFQVQPTTKYITPRIRGRQLALRIESNTSGAFWRLGALRVRIAPDGRK